MYNEMVVLKLVQSMTKLIVSPPEVFKDQIHEHFRRTGGSFYNRIKSWMELSEVDSRQKDEVTGKSKWIETCWITDVYSHRITESDEALKPEFPLIPASKGFCLTLVSFLEGFYKKLQEINPAP